MQYLGIDPGKSGCIVVLDTESNNIKWCKLSETDHDIWEWLDNAVNPLHANATIESVHSMPQQSSQSGFTFGRSFGFLLGILTAIRVPYHLVTPQVWQKKMQCKTRGDKNISKAAAQRLWPKLKITHATADALLIAEYGRLHIWQ